MITEALFELGRKHRSMTLFVETSLDLSLKTPLKNWFGDRYWELAGGAPHAMGQVTGYALTGKTPFVLAPQSFYSDFLGRGFGSLMVEPALNVKLISFVTPEQDSMAPSLLKNVSICDPSPERLPSSVVSMMAAYGPVYLEVPLAI